MTIPDDSVEAMRHAQSALILSEMDRWLRSAPGRQIHITHDALTGVRVALTEERTSHGESIRDAAAQVTTALMVDAEDTA